MIGEVRIIDRHRRSRMAAHIADFFSPVPMEIPPVAGIFGYS